MQKKIKHILLVLLSVISINAIAQNFPEKSNPPRIVNDYTNFLSSAENQALENKLVNFSYESSTQIAVVIVPDLEGYDPASYAFALGDKWGIGQKGKNNGILILVKPKYQNSKGEVFIATGYGMEGSVPDAITKRIVNNEIIPYFKQGMYYKGLDAATNRIMELTRGEYTADQYKEATKGSAGSAGSAIPGIIIFLIVIIFSFVGRAKRARHYAVGHNVPFWIALGMMSSNRSHGGSYGSFSSGGGSFGGGGFGGFGGGGFGGGGAGGSW